MDIVATAIDALSTALAPIDHAAIGPLIMVGAVLAAGAWLVARLRRSGRAKV